MIIECTSTGAPLEDVIKSMIVGLTKGMEQTK